MKTNFKKYQMMKLKINQFYTIILKKLKSTRVNFRNSWS